MPASNSKFGEITSAETVASAFPSQIKGKIILITGANKGGIGGATAIALAAHSPRLLILAGRTRSKVDDTIAAINSTHGSVSCKFLDLNLSLQNSCRTAAEEIMQDPEIPQIDILINNAGVMDPPQRELSPDGIEIQFATNHIGHFLFTNLIMPKILKATANAEKGATRIINVSSRGVVYGPVRFSDINITKLTAELPKTERPNWEELAKTGITTETSPYTTRVGYAQSKSANVLFSVELTKRLYEKHGILSCALHPGVIMTELGRSQDPKILEKALEMWRARGLYFKSLSGGASTTLTAALDPKLTAAPEDVFLSDCQCVDWAPKWATDPALAGKLWVLSEDLVGEKFE